MRSTDPFAFQLEVTSMLLDHHLAGLSAEDLFWAPAPIHWTMHADGSGGWQPDWADTEPDPVPVPTVAWLSWHLQWWWSSTLADVQGRPAPAHSDVDWQPDPDRIRTALAALRTAWSEVLTTTSDADLDVPSGYPWPADAGRSRRDQFAWVTIEHTKNVAELGQLMMLRRAHPAAE
ncbi:DinB family protein [Microlunatus speluncae]|uniref:DinB family protein n=1 Tax=Microlunatus speluncae TaxID=2594267 RepID=UPI001266265F|nr:DinB family protein [Microlunatus speluncae]